MKTQTLILILILAAGYQLKAQQSTTKITKYQMAQPTTTADEKSPVTWTYSAEKINATEAVVSLKATINKGWRIYSQKINKGGPVKTSFTFQPSKDYTLIGSLSEPKPILGNDKTYHIEVYYFENSVVFKQKIKLKTKHLIVKGILEYMASKGTQYLSPVDTDFKVMM